MNALEYILYETINIVNDHVYVFDRLSGCIVDVTSSKTRFVEKVKFKTTEQIVSCNDRERIFYFSVKDSLLACFNIKNEEIQYFSLPNCGFICKNIFNYENKVYIFFSDSAILLEFDKDKCICGENRIFKKEIACSKLSLCQLYKEELIVLIPNEQAYIPYSYSLKSKMVKIICKSFGANYNIQSNSIFMGRDLLYVYQDLRIDTLNIYNGKEDEIDLHEVAKHNGFTLETKEVTSIVVCDEKVLLLPGIGEKIYIWDLKRNEFLEYMDYPKNYRYLPNKTATKFINYYIYNENVILSNRFGNYYGIVNLRSGAVTWKSAKLSKESVDIRKREIQLEREIHLEQDIPLGEYVNLITLKTSCKNKKEICGIKILNESIGQIGKNNEVIGKKK